MNQIIFLLLFSLLWGPVVAIANYYKGQFDLVPGRIYWVSPKQWGGQSEKYHPVVVIGSDTLTNGWGVLVVEITHHPFNDAFKPLKNYYAAGTLIPPAWHPRVILHSSPIDKTSRINTGQARVVLAFSSVVRKAAWDLDMKPKVLEQIVKDISTIGHFTVRFFPHKLAHLTEEYNGKQSRPPWLSKPGFSVLGMDNYLFDKNAFVFTPDDHIRDLEKKDFKLTVRNPGAQTDTSTASCTKAQGENTNGESNCAAPKSNELAVIPTGPRNSKPNKKGGGLGSFVGNRKVVPAAA